MNRKPTVTIDWGGRPVIDIGDGKIYNKELDLIFNKKYYPEQKLDEYPIDPETGERLEITSPFDKNNENIFAICLVCFGLLLLVVLIFSAIYLSKS